MGNEFDKLFGEIIWQRATDAHEARCANASICSDWHIRNDYLPKIAREVTSEISDALSRVSDRKGQVR